MLAKPQEKPKLNKENSDFHLQTLFNIITFCNFKEEIWKRLKKRLYNTLATLKNYTQKQKSKGFKANVCTLDQRTNSEEPNTENTEKC